MTLKLKPRKIQSISYTFLVSLPKVWLDQFGAGKGSLIEMSVTDDKKLILEVQKHATAQ